MEESLADWYYPSSGFSGSFGGGEYNSRGGDTRLSAAVSRSGRRSARMTVRGSGGTRLFRWLELRTNRDTTVSAWFYFPRNYRLTGSRAKGRYLNLFQFKSRTPRGANDPLLWLNVANRGRVMRLQLMWWHRTLKGPRRGQSGFRRIRQRVADVPVRRWFQLEARLRQSKDYDGRLTVRQDGERIFDLRGIRTSYENCTYNAWCAANEWAVNNYTDGLRPSPATIYVDDAGIRRN